MGEVDQEAVPDDVIGVPADDVVPDDVVGVPVDAGAVPDDVVGVPVYDAPSATGGSRRASLLDTTKATPAPEAQVATNSNQYDTPWNVEMMDAANAKELGVSYRARIPEQRALDNAKIREAIAISRSGVSTEQEITEMASVFGVPTDQVRKALPEFKKALETSKADPDEFRKKNPILTDIILRNPNAGQSIMVSKEQPLLLQAYHAVSDWWADQSTGAHVLADVYSVSLTGGASLISPAIGRIKAAIDGTEYQGDKKLTDEQKAKRDAPDQVLELDTPEAQKWRAASAASRVFGSGAPLAVNAARRFYEGSKQIELSVLGNDLLQAEVAATGMSDLEDRLQDAAKNLSRAEENMATFHPESYGARARALEQYRKEYDDIIGRVQAASSDEIATIRGKINDLRLEPRLHLGDNDTLLDRELSGAAEMAPMSVDIAAHAGVAALRGASIGAFVGAAAGPGGVIAGASTGAEISAEAEVFRRSAELEIGGDYLSNRERLMPNGRHMTINEAAGTSILSGTVKGGIEVLKFENFGRALGVPFKGLASETVGLLEGSFVERAPGLLSTLRQSGRVAVESAAGESFQEGVQSIAEQVSPKLVETFMGQGLKEGSYLSDGEWVNPDEVVRSAHSALGLGLLTGGLGVSTAMMGAAVQSKRVMQSARQAQVLFEIGLDPQFDANAKEIAAGIERDSSSSGGKSVIGLHVKSKALAKYFQDEKVDGEAAVVAILGENAKGKLAEAIETGAELLVPTEKIGAWAKSDVGQATRFDASAQPNSLSLREIATGEQERQKAESAKEVERQIQKLKKDASADAIFDHIYQSAIDAGQEPKVAEAVGLAWKAFFNVRSQELSETMGKEDGVEGPVGPTALDIFREHLTEIQSNEVVDSSSIVSERLRQGFSLEEMAHHRFIDPVSQLRNREGWDAEPRQEGRGVIAVTTILTKPVNDHPAGGHDVSNTMLARIGRIIGTIDPEAAREGPKFLLHGNASDVSEVIRRVQEQMPEGVVIDAGHGVDAKTASEAMDEAVDSKRKSGAYPKRGETPLFAAPVLESLSDQTFLAPGVEPLKPNISKRMLEEVGRDTYSHKEHFEKSLIDKDMPGIWNALGFSMAPSRKFVVSIDLRSLRLVNKWMGKKFGDKLMSTFAKKAMEAGGGSVDLAHLSGDEFAAKHDNRFVLELFVKDLEKALESAKIAAFVDVIKDGVATEQFVGTITPKFRFGIGEKTYGQADRVLNEKKRNEPSGQGIDPEGIGAIAGLDTAGKQEVHPQGGWEGSGEIGQLPPGGQSYREAVVDDSFDFGNAAPTAKATPEQLASARAWVDRMKSKAKRKYATKLINFIEGKGEAPTENSEEFESIGIQMANNLGVVDPRLGVNDRGQLVYGGKTSSPAQAKAREARRRSMHVDKAARAKAREKNLELANLKAGRALKQDPANGRTARGFSYIPDPKESERIYSIFLNKDADRSTLMHESAHIFLDILGHLASQPDASPKTKELFSGFLKWSGAESWEKLAEEHHEKFAVAFEQYLARGNAPTTELQTVFSRFRYWLMGVYRTVKSMLGQSRPDIDALFDRLLATQDEIDRHQGKRGLARTAEEAGMTEEEWQAIKPTEEEELEFATKPAWLRAHKESLRASQEFWKDELKAEMKAKAAEYEALPARIAEIRLRKVTLDEAAVAEILPKKSDQRRFDLDKRHGVLPDEAASFLGYPTGKAMLEAVAGLSTKENWVKKEAEAAMNEKYPGILEDQKKLQEEIERDMLSFSEQKILRNWAILSKKAPEGLVGPLPKEMLQATAAQLVARTTIRVLNPNEALVRERSFAREKALAGVRGNWLKAQESAKEEILNAFMYREMLKARDERTALQKVVADLNTKAGRVRLGKADEALLNASDDILAVLGMSDDGVTPGEAVKSVEAAVKLMSDLGYIQPDDAWVRGIEGALSKTDWRDLTVTEMRIVRDALDAIRTTASSMTTVINGEKRAEMDYVANQLIREAEENNTSVKLPSTEDAATLKDSLYSRFRGRDGSLLQIRTMANWLGGGQIDSAWARSILEPIQDSKTRSAELTHEHIKGVHEKLEKAGKKLRKELDKSFDGAKAFKNHKIENGETIPPPTTMREVFVMALHLGNPSNINKLTLGRNITLDEVMAATNQLSKEAWDLVQEIWDSAEALGNLQFELEKRDRGVTPPRIEARALMTDHGIYRGGYFPVGYDSRVPGPGGKSEVAVAESQTRQISTAQGNLKERADGFNGAVSLNMSSISKHFQRVVHDIAYRESLRSVSQLILRDDVKAALIGRLGPERSGQFKQWLLDIATTNSDEVSAHTRESTMSAKNIKANVVSASLGYSFPTAMGDLSMFGAGLAAGKYGIGDFGKAVSVFALNPNEMLRQVDLKSPEFRAQRLAGRLSLQKELNLSKKTGVAHLAQWLKDHAFVLFDLTYAYTAAPTWTAAYGHARESLGMSDADAIRYGDNTLLQVFPSHNVADKAAILRDKGYVGMLTTMYSFWNARYNLNRDVLHFAAKDVRESDSSVDKATRIAKAVGKLVAMSLVFGVASEIMTGRGPDPGDDDPQHPGDLLYRYFNYTKRKVIADQISQFPHGADVAGIYERYALGKTEFSEKHGGVLSATGAFLELIFAVFKLVESGENSSKKDIQKAYRLTAPLTGLPTNQAWRVGDFIYRMTEGSIDPSLLDTVGGLGYGPERWDQMTGDPIDFSRH